MRRLARRTLNGLTVLSLLLFIAAVALWVRSRYSTDTVWHHPGRGITGFYAPRGSIGMVCLRYSAVDPAKPDVGPPRWFIEHTPAADAAAPLDRLYGVNYWHYAGFAWGGRLDSMAQIDRVVIIPLWAVLLTAAIAPALFVRQRFKQCRRRHGLCPTCAYDLRATPDRCPECGTSSVVKGAS